MGRPRQPGERQKEPKRWWHEPDEGQPKRWFDTGGLLDRTFGLLTRVAVVGAIVSVVYLTLTGDFFGWDG